jgi:hypothetical protein
MARFLPSVVDRDSDYFAVSQHFVAPEPEAQDEESQVADSKYLLGERGAGSRQ